jgi:hypothetical protein
MSKLRFGPNGFAEAVFDDGEVKLTEFPNLELDGLHRPVLKKPAIQKKPAAETEPTREDITVQDEASENETSEVEVASSLPRLSNKYTYPDGTDLKLGKFSGQSYITYKKLGVAKYTLLVACSQKQAARNGKSHHEIMDAIFGHAKSFPSMPSKEDCNKYKMSILLQ